MQPTEEPRQLCDAARIALPNGHALPKLAELLRRTHESGDPMAPLTGLGDERPACAAGSAEDEESHRDHRCHDFHPAPMNAALLKSWLSELQASIWLRPEN